MLEELIIKDYALIDKLSVHFDTGLNIITGETGAGKSIIIGALSFLLGGKADIDIIRTGCEEASVSGVISIRTENKDVTAWLLDKDISTDDGHIIIRRNLKKSGRGSIYIQDVPVTRNDLLELTAYLFDIHGQHEHQALLKKENHRRYLDRFAGIEEEVQAFTALFFKLSEKRKEFDASIESEKQRNEKQELLTFAIQEIVKANPKVGEIAELEAEAKKLAEYEKLSALVSNAAETLSHSELSAIPLIRKTKTALESASSIDPSLSVLAQRFSDLYYELEDASDQLSEYKESLRFDANRLEAIEERLAVLFKLRKKYGETEEAILAYQKQAEAELDRLSKIEEDRALLKTIISKLEQDISHKASEITSKRQSAAKILADRITSILSTLGMPKAQFVIQVQTKGMNGNSKIIGPYGADDIEFLISANLGEPVKELSKIASGGELSRVMLAIKTVLANTDTVETLVFDEIDTGIGGEVALSVGEHLAQVGKTKQIFCITHLASIAVRADNHLKVEKRIDSGRTITTLRCLEPFERREEIARMLAGDAAANAALAHADELLLKYNRGGK
ncbi:DNA repair protein RecN [Gracilinema caldarium]|uniref:DNA repair protein RecN n=1 Tax=Gracilinema caldarium (strain ATCC 51460 / DSM 7334 / H1) TaxID=744872 RepID=F8F3J7_GRAC1|nr:DNA repair protein RecN [Gracilinema caldarium]AEJ19941.1 DNA repair protein RecN [Gracilinema caldarium DSM 7334]